MINKELFDLYVTPGYYAELQGEKNFVYVPLIAEPGESFNYGIGKEKN